MAKTKINWPAVRQEVNQVIGHHRDCLEELHEVLSPYFAHVIADRARTGKVDDRKPPIAVRIPLQGGEPEARMVAAPLWHVQKKVLLAETVLINVDVKLEGRKNDWCALTVTLKRGAHFVGRISLYSAGLVPRIQDAVRQLIASPQELFARSHDHCCSCGRTLTDPESQARGVGPECLRHAAALFDYVTALRQKATASTTTSPI